MDGLFFVTGYTNGGVHGILDRVCELWLAGGMHLALSHELT